MQMNQKRKDNYHLTSRETTQSQTVAWQTSKTEEDEKKDNRLTKITEFKALEELIKLWGSNQNS